MSLDLYISESSLVIGTFPMVFLKNTSSIVDGLIERKAGKSNKSFPKRQGCVGYLGNGERKKKKSVIEVFRCFSKENLSLRRKIAQMGATCAKTLFCTHMSQKVDPKANSPNGG